MTNPYLRLAPALVSLLALGLLVLNFRTQAASAKIKPLQHERVHVPEHGQEYYPGGSEVQALATIGAFRVVAADDLRDDQGRPGDLRHGDLERLPSAGLMRVVTPLDRTNRTAIVTLGQRGRDVLDTRGSRGAAPRHTFHATAVKSRELSRDTQLCRPYLRAADRLQAQDARIERVVLEDELKREYRKFLQERNRDRPHGDRRPDRSGEEVRQWRIEHDLPVVNDAVQFPDFRIEDERPDLQREVENVDDVHTAEELWR